MRTAANDDAGFALGQTGAGRVGAQSRGVTDRGKDRGAGDAKTDGDVALEVIGRAAHPALVRASRRPRFLFSNCKCRGGRGAVKLIPANAGAKQRIDGRINRVVRDQGFARAEVAIRQAPHQTIADRIEEAAGGRGRRLRHHVAAVRNRSRIESGDSQRTADAFGKGRVCRNGEVCMEIEDSQLIAGFTEFTGLEISEGTRRSLPAAEYNLPYRPATCRRCRRVHWRLPAGTTPLCRSK